MEESTLNTNLTPLPSGGEGGGLPPILAVGDVLISSDLITEEFCCDLEACRGACCVEGDAGAPVTLDEVMEIENRLDDVWDGLSASAQAVIDRQGVAYTDQEGDLVTSIVGGKDCVFTCHEDLTLDDGRCVSNCCLCTLEKAWRAAQRSTAGSRQSTPGNRQSTPRSQFIKPISCALYPIREKQFSDGSIGLNYHRWEVCRPAVKLGQQRHLKVYQYLREPLIRRFGEAWYAELCEVARQLLPIEKTMKSLQFILVVAMTLLTACTGRTARSDAEEQRDSVAFKYAQLIHIDRYDGYDVARIDNPWKAGATLHSYVLIDRNTDARRVPTDRFPSATIVRVPLQRSIIFTSVHAALAAQLKAEQQVVGVADLKYIKVPFVQEGVSSGRLVDCGEGMSPTIEKIIDSEADAILLSPFENSGGYGQLDEVDIPLIECAEYMEQSPLARAEWMRFYGLLYGCQQRVDSLFAVVDSSYNALCQLARSSRVKRSVLVDKQTGSVWYVPGGRSTIGRMLADAQCNYPFSADDHSGSLSLPFEAVLEKAGESDVWLLRYDSQQPLTLPQLLSEQPGYTQLRPATTGEVYGCNVTTSMFYEESPFRPDLLLQDFIQLLHPDLSGLPALRYYHRLAGPDSAR